MSPRAKPWEAELRALSGVTQVMVHQFGSVAAGTIVARQGYIVSVKLASGPNSGKVLDFPVSRVRPAEAFEVVQ